MGPEQPLEATVSSEGREHACLSEKDALKTFVHLEAHDGGAAVGV